MVKYDSKIKFPPILIKPHKRRQLIPKAGDRNDFS